MRYITTPLTKSWNPAFRLPMAQTESPRNHQFCPVPAHGWTGSAAGAAVPRICGGLTCQRPADRHSRQRGLRPIKVCCPWPLATISDRLTTVA